MIWDALLTVFRQLGRISPHHLLTQDQINSISWASVVAGCGGAIAGSMIRHRMNTYLLVMSTVAMGTNLAVHFGLVTIHWDRIEELKQRLPEPLKKTVNETAPRVWNLVWSLPMSSVFFSGFLVGFKYL